MLRFPSSCPCNGNVQFFTPSFRYAAYLMHSQIGVKNWTFPLPGQLDGYWCCILLGDWKLGYFFNSCRSAATCFHSVFTHFRPTHFFGEKGPVSPGFIEPTQFLTASSGPVKCFFNRKIVVFLLKNRKIWFCYLRFCKWPFLYVRGKIQLEIVVNYILSATEDSQQNLCRFQQNIY